MMELYTLLQIMRCVFHGPHSTGMTLLAPVGCLTFTSVFLSRNISDIDHPSKGPYSCRNIKLLAQTHHHASFLSGKFSVLNKVQRVSRKE